MAKNLKKVSIFSVLLISIFLIGTYFPNIPVPAQDSANNTYISDVIGNKTDTTSGNSLISITKKARAEAVEAETHIHSYAKKFEKATAPSGETHVADRIGSGNGSYQIDAGNDNWGSWVQVIGSGDTPAVAGKTYFDFHVIQIESTERAETYFLQFGFGTTGAAALSANTYSDIIYTAQSNQIDSAPIFFQSERQAVGTKVWARCMCPGQNTATINFYVGLHEYDE